MIGRYAQGVTTTAPTAAHVDDDDLADLADAIIAIAHRLTPRGRDSGDLIPLTGSEIEVVRAVHAHPRITPTQLSAAIGMGRNNISTAVRSLEARGIVVRHRPAGDGRSVELETTDLAAQNLQRARAVWVQRLRAATEPTVRDSAAARDALRRLADELSS